MKGTLKAWLTDLSPVNELTRTPLEADVPCPKCGAETWDRVEWRADPDAPSERFRGLECRGCGHIEVPYSVQKVGPSEAELGDSPSAAEILAAASFPVYVPDRPPFGRISFGGRGWHDERLGAVGLLASDAARAVRVWSYVDPGRVTPADTARAFLYRELEASLPAVSDADEDVVTLKRNAALRSLRAAADAARAETVTMAAEAGAKALQLVEHQGHWAASADGIMVAGRNVKPSEVALRLLRPDDELA
jgi:hypothetical protein